MLMFSVESPVCVCVYVCRRGEGKGGDRENEPYLMYKKPSSKVLGERGREPTLCINWTILTSVRERAVSLFSELLNLLLFFQWRRNPCQHDIGREGCDGVSRGQVLALVLALTLCVASGEPFDHRILLNSSIKCRWSIASLKWKQIQTDSGYPGVGVG